MVQELSPLSILKVIARLPSNHIQDMETLDVNGTLDHTTSLWRIILALAVALIIALTWIVVPLVLRVRKSKLWVIPGPPSTSWILGNLREYNESPRDLISDEWMERYGSVVRIHGFLQVHRHSCG